MYITGSFKESPVVLVVYEETFGLLKTFRSVGNSGGLMDSEGDSDWAGWLGLNYSNFTDNSGQFGYCYCGAFVLPNQRIPMGACD